MAVNWYAVQVPVAARELPWFFDDFFRILNKLENRANALKSSFETEDLEDAQRRFSSSITDYGLHIIMLDSIQERLKDLPPGTGWRQEWSDNLDEFVLAGKKLAQYLYSIRRNPTPENIDQTLEQVSAIRTATLYVLFGAELDRAWEKYNEALAKMQDGNCKQAIDRFKDALDRTKKAMLD